MVNLREVLEPIDIVRKIARVRVEDAYNSLLLRHGDGWSKTRTASGGA